MRLPPGYGLLQLFLDGESHQIFARQNARRIVQIVDEHQRPNAERSENGFEGQPAGGAEASMSAQ